MEKLFDENELLWTIIPLAIIAASFLYFGFIYLRHRKKSNGDTGGTGSQPEKPGLGAFISYLRKKELTCEQELEKLQEFSKSYQPTKGNEFDFVKLIAGFPAKGFLEAEKLTEDFKHLLKHPHSGRIVRAMSEINTDLAVQEEGIRELEINFKANYAKIIRAFGENIVSLSQLFDQLKIYIKGKKLKPEVDAYVKKYLGIFQDWASSGADKSIKVMRNDVAIKILALNKLYPQNPFIKQTEDAALKCEGAYEAISQLDESLQRKLRHYQNAYKKARKQLGLISSPTGLANVQKPVANKLSPAAAQTREAVVPGIQPVRQPIWTPRRWARLITGLILALAVLGIGGYYLWNYLAERNLEPSFFSGHSVPAPNETDKIDSHKEHFQTLKPLLDSLDEAKVPQELLDSLNYQIDSTDSSEPDSLVELQATRDSLVRLKQEPGPPEPEYGIDVSHYQGKIDWARVAADTSGAKPLHFAIMKASQGTRADPKFQQNWDSARLYLGFVGAYHFYQFSVDPVAQAQFFTKTVDFRPGDIRPIIDVEPNCSGCQATGGLSTEELIKRVGSFLEVTEKACSCKAIIYTGDYFYRKYLKGNFPDNDFWLAEYSKNKSVTQIIQSHVNPKDNEVAVMWQFTSGGTVDGVKGRVDMNYLPGQYLERVLIPK